MANTIQIKHSASTGALSPANMDGTGGNSATTLAKGELAWVDHGTGGANGKLYIGDATSGGAVERHIGGIGTGAVAAAAAAGSLTGSTLASGVTASSLTSLGTIGTLTATNFVIGGHTVSDIDRGGEFNDVEDHVMSSAAVNDRIGAIALLDSECTDLAAVKATEDPFTAALLSKLNAIEASADVTDATNVTAAGALMDSECTDLAAVKAFTGEAAATADQTGAEIVALVESTSDSNTFTDADHTKLNAIEASADVTDAANVKSALGGAMGSNTLQIGDGSTTTTFPGDVVVTGTQTVNNVVTVSTSNGVQFEGTAADGHDMILKSAVADSDKTVTIPNATFTIPTQDTTYTVGDGGLTQINFTSADNTKLDAIEASADVTDTANVTAAGALMDSECTDLAAVKAFTGEAAADVTDTANVTSAGALMDSELTAIAHVKALNQSVISGATPTFTVSNFSDVSDKRFMSDAQETKLDSVESSADVTDATNVTAAGALMDSELTAIAHVKALNQSVISGAAPTFLTTNFTAASATVAGVIELATDAETITGTATNRAITPANLAASTISGGTF